ncbi:transketolase [Aeromicrobium choanae]|uniref:Transketolase n=1 Tax=Aeromicrobium choanae TaxID=1736691 RepID=A0A1T4YLQ3_9ACTN|nr:transketolase [Aeromicrobium choanae]SKB02764.1 transketolase [Aeromicrobium choanae]
MTNAPHATEPTIDWSDVDDRAVNTARLLAADAVQKAGHGHPGTAMSLAPAAYLIYQKLMRHDPADPSWIGRDRFVLSCGHSSLTQYIQLFLSGYPMSLDDLKSLRTWGSQTPGHPEYGHTPGVEVTTGPLGQGVANAVGMAMAARRERGLFDPFAGPGESPFDHDIYAICSDGDLQEGVSGEASSLAGLQELGNLTLLYDDNKISIEDDTDVAFTEDVALRYEAYGWHVQTVDWTHGGGEYREDVHALADAFASAKLVTDRPSLIVLRTIIAWPAPNAQNTGAAHGSALGADEIKATKELLGFDPEVDFAVDDEVLEHTRGAIQRGADAREEWQTRFDLWVTANGERKTLLDRLTSRELPDGWDADLPVYEPNEKGVATRVASGDFLSAAAPHLPELWGGSADLAGSNNTTPKDQPSFLPPQNSTKKFSGDWYGRVLHFGIREHAMGSIMNGIALHGPTRPYGGTFLVFSDYMRPAVRLAALQELPVTYVWTHDSIGLGEDGPTHQPVEHLAALRTIPGLDVVRPADANETVAVWSTILQRHHRPAALALSRQNLPVFPRDGEYAPASEAAKGAYVLLDSPAELHHATPDVIIVATGSEVQLAVEARSTLAEQGIGARVVSMPCREWFEEQDQAYRDSVIPPHVRARVVVEAGVAFGWRDIVGDAGRIVSLEHFGASANYSELYERFGITAASTAAAATESIQAAQHEGGVPVFARPTGPVLPDTTH